MARSKLRSAARSRHARPSPLHLEPLEPRQLLAGFLATAPDSGSSGFVQLHADLDNNGSYETPLEPFRPFPELKVGVRALLADINADGNDELITAAAAKVPKVKIFELTSDGTVGPLMDSFMAFPAEYKCGLSLGVGRINGTSGQDIIIATDKGPVSTVRLYSDSNWDGRISDGLMDEFVPFETSYRGGLRVAAGDTNGDFWQEVVVAPAGRHAPQLRIYTDSDHDGQVTDEAGGETVIVPGVFRAGMNVAVGKLTNLGTATNAEIVVGPENGAGPFEILADDNGDGKIESVYANTSMAGWTGVRVAIADIDFDGNNEIITAPGKSGATLPVQVWKDDGDDGDSPLDNAPLGADTAFTDAINTSVNVAFGQFTRSVYGSIDTPRQIADNDSILSCIMLPPSVGIARRIVVNVNIGHPIDNELTVSLSHYMLGGVTLLSHINGINNGFVLTIDDAATVDIAADTGHSPLAGYFNPQGPAALADLANVDSSGLWALEVEDNSGGNVGNLYSWSLELYF